MNTLALITCLLFAGPPSLAGATPDNWAARRAEIITGFSEVIGPLPKPEKPWPLEVRVESEHEEATYIRRKIIYQPEPKDFVAAWLLIPKDLKGKAPAVLCLHQTIDIGKDEPAGLGENDHLDYARELAERGYVTLAPDYPTFGDSKDNNRKIVCYDGTMMEEIVQVGLSHLDAYTLGYQSITAKGIWNHMRAVDVLQSLPEVDPERIGCIGHSLGGHNTLFLAAMDVRIKAAVTSCGFCTFATYYQGDLHGWSQRRYMPRIETVYNNDPAKMPFDFDGILAAIAPRGVFISAPTGDANFDLGGVKDAVNKARPVFEMLGADENLVAIHPEAEHSFPREAREAAYAALDNWLREDQ